MSEMDPQPEASKSIEESLEAERCVADSNSNGSESLQFQPSLANAQARNT